MIAFLMHGQYVLLYIFRQQVLLHLMFYSFVMGNISWIWILCLGLSVYLFQKIVFNYMAFNRLIMSVHGEGYSEARRVN